MLPDFVFGEGPYGDESIRWPCIGHRAEAKRADTGTYVARFAKYGHRRSLAEDLALGTRAVEEAIAQRRES